MRTLITTTLITILLCTTAILAEQGDQRENRGIDGFLTADGSVDWDFLRHSGYEGNLNIDGFTNEINPVTGEPRFAPVSAAAVPDDQYWGTLTGLEPDEGMNGTIYDLVVYNGELIAGGAFTTAGDVSANNIARWNGSS